MTRIDFPSGRRCQATGRTGAIAAIASRHPAVSLAVGVVRDGRLSDFHGHGLADIASRTPVTKDTAFRIGSITKTFTAIAVLQLCEQGLIDLDSPAGRYLRAYPMIPAKRGHRPPTVRELLTHTAGLPQLLYPARAFQPVLGETVAYGQPVPALAEFGNSGGWGYIGFMVWGGFLVRAMTAGGGAPAPVRPEASYPSCVP